MYEINLVPDIKEQMIKAQKMRNFIFFICIVVVAAVVGVVLILLSIKGVQDINMTSQDARLKQMSATIKSYSDLEELLTLQGQLNKIDEIGSKRKVFSRVFSIIGTILPTNADKITISELTVNLGENTFTVNGQADAGNDNIDYRVLEAFKKSMLVMKFDYGRFVDENNRTIPTRCIIEADEDGNTYMEGNDVFVYWTREKKGCDPGRDDGEEEQEDGNEVILELEGDEDGSENIVVDENSSVKIYRTPRFKEWYNDGKMKIDGSINDIPHFESECITYSGSVEGKKVTWATDNKCELTTGDRIVIDNDETSNARDESGKLVLKFVATIYLNEDVLSFKNKHMMAIAPSGRQNMTDSYLQIEGMFAKEAEDCKPDDTACLSNKQNTGD